MFYHQIDPVLLHLGPFQIRYYGIIYVLGFVITYFFMNWFSKERKLGLTKEDVSDMIFWLLIGVVSGARTFYVIFYNPVYFFHNPLQSFAVWNGGLSFHGGLFGGTIAIMLFCKKHKLRFLEIADLMMIPAALALCFGRIGNFLNGELVGRVTNVSWCVNFQGYEGCRHPSQLYESAKNLFIFFVLMFMRKKKYPHGTLLFTFIGMYGVLRFFIEYVRAPDVQLGFIFFGLTMGQLLNIVMVLIAGIVILYLQKKKNV